MPQCAVTSCHKKVTGKAGVNFFPFPRDLAHRQLWAQMSGWTDELMRPNKEVICSAHFDEKSFYRDPRTGARKLKSGAVPTISVTKNVQLKHCAKETRSNKKIGRYFFRHALQPAANILKKTAKMRQKYKSSGSGALVSSSKSDVSDAPGELPSVMTATTSTSDTTSAFASATCAVDSKAQLPSKPVVSETSTRKVHRNVLRACRLKSSDAKLTTTRKKALEVSSSVVIKQEVLDEDDPKCQSVPEEPNKKRRAFKKPFKRKRGDDLLQKTDVSGSKKLSSGQNDTAGTRPEENQIEKEEGTAEVVTRQKKCFRKMRKRKKGSLNQKLPELPLNIHETSKIKSKLFPNLIHIKQEPLDSADESSVTGDSIVINNCGFKQFCEDSVQNVKERNCDSGERSSDSSDRCVSTKVTTTSKHSEAQKVVNPLCRQRRSKKVPVGRKKVLKGFVVRAVTEKNVLKSVEIDKDVAVCSRELAPSVGENVECPNKNLIDGDQEQETSCVSANNCDIPKEMSILVNEIVDTISDPKNTQTSNHCDTVFPCVNHSHSESSITACENISKRTSADEDIVTGGNVSSEYTTAHTDANDVSDKVISSSAVQFNTSPSSNVHEISVSQVYTNDSLDTRTLVDTLGSQVSTTNTTQKGPECLRETSVEVQVSSTPADIPFPNSSKDNPLISKKEIALSPETDSLTSTNDSNYSSAVKPVTSKPRSFSFDSKVFYGKQSVSSHAISTSSSSVCESPCIETPPLQNIDINLISEKVSNCDKAPNFTASATNKEGLYKKSVVSVSDSKMALETTSPLEEGQATSSSIKTKVPHQLTIRRKSSDCVSECKSLRSFQRRNSLDISSTDKSLEGDSAGIPENTSVKSLTPCLNSRVSEDSNSTLGALAHAKRPTNLEHVDASSENLSNVHALNLTAQKTVEAFDRKDLSSDKKPQDSTRATPPETKASPKYQAPKSKLTYSRDKRKTLTTNSFINLLVKQKMALRFRNILPREVTMSSSASTSTSLASNKASSAEIESKITELHNKRPVFNKTILRGPKKTACVSKNVIAKNTRRIKTKVSRINAASTLGSKNKNKLDIRKERSETLTARHNALIAFGPSLRTEATAPNNDNIRTAQIQNINNKDVKVCIMSPETITIGQTTGVTSRVLKFTCTTDCGTDSLTSKKTGITGILKSGGQTRCSDTSSNKVHVMKRYPLILPKLPPSTTTDASVGMNIPSIDTANSVRNSACKGSVTTCTKTDHQSQGSVSVDSKVITLTRLDVVPSALEAKRNKHKSFETVSRKVTDSKRGENQKENTSGIKMNITARPLDFFGAASPKEIKTNVSHISEPSTNPMLHVSSAAAAPALKMNVTARPLDFFSAASPKETKPSVPHLIETSPKPMLNISPATATLLFVRPELSLCVSQSNQEKVCPPPSMITILPVNSSLETVSLGSCPSVFTTPEIRNKGAALSGRVNTPLPFSSTKPCSLEHQLESETQRGNSKNEASTTDKSVTVEQSSSPSSNQTSMTEEANNKSPITSEKSKDVSLELIQSPPVTTLNFKAEAVSKVIQTVLELANRSATSTVIERATSDKKLPTGLEPDDDRQKLGLDLSEGILRASDKNEKIVGEISDSPNGRLLTSINDSSVRKPCSKIGSSSQIATQSRRSLDIYDFHSDSSNDSETSTAGKICQGDLESTDVEGKSDSDHHVASSANCTGYLQQTPDISRSVDSSEKAHTDEYVSQTTEMIAPEAPLETTNDITDSDKSKEPALKKSSCTNPDNEQLDLQIPDKSNSPSSEDTKLPSPVSTQSNLESSGSPVSPLISKICNYFEKDEHQNGSSTSKSPEYTSSTNRIADDDVCKPSPLKELGRLGNDCPEEIRNLEEISLSSKFDLPHIGDTIADDDSCKPSPPKKLGALDDDCPEEIGKLEVSVSSKFGLPHIGDTIADDDSCKSSPPKNLGGLDDDCPEEIRKLEVSVSSKFDLPHIGDTIADDDSCKPSQPKKLAGLDDDCPEEIRKLEVSVSRKFDLPHITDTDHSDDLEFGISTNAELNILAKEALEKPFEDDCDSDFETTCNSELPLEIPQTCKQKQTRSLLPEPEITDECLEDNALQQSDDLQTEAPECSNSEKTDTGSKTVNESTALKEPPVFETKTLDIESTTLKDPPVFETKTLDIESTALKEPPVFETKTLDIESTTLKDPPVFETKTLDIESTALKEPPVFETKTLDIESTTLKDPPVFETKTLDIESTALKDPPVFETKTLDIENPDVSPSVPYVVAGESSASVICLNADEKQKDLSEVPENRGSDDMKESKEILVSTNFIESQDVPNSVPSACTLSVNVEEPKGFANEQESQNAKPEDQLILDTDELSDVTLTSTDLGQTISSQENQKQNPGNSSLIINNNVNSEENSSESDVQSRDSSEVTVTVLDKLIDQVCKTSSMFVRNLSLVSENLWIPDDDDEKIVPVSSKRNSKDSVRDRLCETPTVELSRDQETKRNKLVKDKSSKAASTSSEATIVLSYSLNSNFSPADGDGQEELKIVPDVLEKEIIADLEDCKTDNFELPSVEIELNPNASSNVSEAKNAGDVPERPSTVIVSSKKPSRTVTVKTEVLSDTEEDVQIIEPKDLGLVLDCILDTSFLSGTCPNCIRIAQANKNRDPSAKPVLCPLCQQESTPADSLDHLFLLEQLTTDCTKDGDDSKKQVVCTSCDEGGMASGFCLECQEWLCEGCLQAHQRVRVTKDHSIRSREEMDVEKPTTALQQKYMFCPIHRQEHLKLYCETCDKLTCRDCQLLEHRDHRYQFLSDACQQHKQYLKSLLLKTKEKLAYIQTAQNLINQRHSEISEREQHVTAEIKMFAVKFISEINRRGKLLLQELNEVCSKKKQQLSKKNEELVSLAKKLEHCMQFTESAIRHGSDIALVSSKKAITYQLRHVLQRRCEVPNPQHIVNINFSYETDYLSQYISRFGNLIVDGQALGAGSSPVPTPLPGRMGIPPNVSLTPNVSLSPNQPMFTMPMRGGPHQNFSGGGPMPRHPGPPGNHNPGLPPPLLSGSRYPGPPNTSPQQQQQQQQQQHQSQLVSSTNVNPTMLKNLLNTSGGQIQAGPPPPGVFMTHGNRMPLMAGGPMVPGGYSPRGMPPMRHPLPPSNHPIPQPMQVQIPRNLGVTISPVNPNIRPQQQPQSTRSMRPLAPRPQGLGHPQQQQPPQTPQIGGSQHSPLRSGSHHMVAPTSNRQPPVIQQQSGNSQQPQASRPQVIVIDSSGGNKILTMGNTNRLSHFPNGSNTAPGQVSSTAGSSQDTRHLHSPHNSQQTGSTSLSAIPSYMKASTSRSNSPQQKDPKGFPQSLSDVLDKNSVTITSINVKGEKTDLMPSCSGGRVTPKDLETAADAASKSLNDFAAKSMGSFLQNNIGRRSSITITESSTPQADSSCSPAPNGVLDEGSSGSHSTSELSITGSVSILPHQNRDLSISAFPSVVDVSMLKDILNNTPKKRSDDECVIIDHPGALKIQIVDTRSLSQHPSSMPIVSTAGSATSQPHADDPNEDWCAVCHDGGELLCCGSCPRVFHLQCHVPPLSSTPSEEWTCLLCMDVLNRSIPKEFSGSKRKNPVGLGGRELLICERILLELLCHESSPPFHEPVSKSVPNYYKVITKPMDMLTIRQKMSPSHFNHYEDAEEFVADLRLIFRNCCFFNEHYLGQNHEHTSADTASSNLFRAASQVEKKFMELLALLLPEINYQSEMEKPPLAAAADAAKAAAAAAAAAAALSREPTPSLNSPAQEAEGDNSNDSDKHRAKKSKISSNGNNSS